MYPGNPPGQPSGVPHAGRSLVISTSGIPRPVEGEGLALHSLLPPPPQGISSRIRQPSGRAAREPDGAPLRWNPLVFEPSMTSFLMVWTCSAGVMPSIFAIVRQTSSASGFIASGGPGQKTLLPKVSVKATQKTP